jgi:putative endopeptidase
VYVTHVARMLELSGLSAADAKSGAQAVMTLETALARASLPAADKRDPYKVYHRFSVAQLRGLTPSFGWSDYLAGRGLSATPSLNVTEPAFMKALEKQLTRQSLAVWKAYLRWHLVSARAPYLSRTFADENFAFYNAHLRGVKEQGPRWKRCVGWVDRDLGEALGQAFVKKAFTPEIKKASEDMTQRIQAAMKQRLQDLAWMEPTTKQQALRKLAQMRNKIGYPAKWRDYGTLDIARGDFAGNTARAAAFEIRRDLGKIGQPVDRDEWQMTPPTVNAYYDAQMNDINFPAGVLLPPLFDTRIDLAPSWGNTGGTIGHELTHGFDDEGRQFDADGNLKDWWTAKDAKEFVKRASCIADQYAKYTVVDDIKINSQLTLGEDVADFGGMVLAWEAWRASIAGQSLAPLDGLTPEQRFFVGFAQWDCANMRDEVLRLNALTNPHSPPRYRINGVVVNMPEFAQSFACQPGQPMVKAPVDVCHVW